MKRAQRLRRPRQFQQVRRAGRVYNQRLLRLTVLRNRRARTRCGFVVGKRIGNAVQRNRAKRRLREAVRLLYDHIAQGYDLVFVVRQSAVIDVPFTQLQATVRHLLTQADLWREPPGTDQRSQPEHQEPLSTYHSSHRPPTSTDRNGEPGA